MDSDKGKEKWNILQQMSIKVNGKMTKNADTEWWIGLLPIKNIRENGKMMFLQEMEVTIGMKERTIIRTSNPFIKVSGKLEKGMV